MFLVKRFRHSTESSIRVREPVNKLMPSHCTVYKLIPLPPCDYNIEVDKLINNKFNTK